MGQGLVSRIGCLIPPDLHNTVRYMDMKKKMMMMIFYFFFKHSKTEEKQPVVVVLGVCKQ